MDSNGSTIHHVQRKQPPWLFPVACMKGDPPLDTSQSNRQRIGPVSALVRPLVALTMIASMLLAAIPAVSPVAAQTSDSLAAYAPADSIAFVEANLDPASSQMTLLSDLLTRANLESLSPEAEEGMLADELGSAAGAFDGKVAAFVSPEVLSNLPLDEVIDEAGSLTNTASLTEEADGLGAEIPGGWALLLQPSDPDAAYAMAQESMQSSDAQTETYGGFDILSAPPSDDSSSGEAVALVNGVIVVSTTADDVKTVIDVVNGDAAAIDSDDTYNQVRGQLPEEVIAFGYINGPAIVDALPASDLDDLSASLGGAALGDVMDSLGAYQGFVAWVDENGFRFDTVAIAGPDAELPTLSAYTPTIPEILPSDTMFFAGGMDLGSIPGLDDLALVFAAGMVGIPLEDAATPVDPDDIFAQAEAVLGFNLKTDVLDQLTGEWAIAGSFDMSSGSGLFVSNVEDPDTVGAVVEKIVALVTSDPDLGATVSTNTVAGSDVTVITIESSGTTMTIEVGMINGELAIGLNGWTEYLGTPASDPLSAATNFSDSLGLLPTDITGLLYINLESLMPIITASMNSFSSFEVEDNDPSCGEFASQEEAQAAYDDDSATNYLLDLDWDGEACEDYFSPATPDEEAAEVASPGITALTAVSWAKDGTVGTSAIIVVNP